jgi:hypothetical protein
MVAKPPADFVPDDGSAGLAEPAPAVIDERR